ncbi:hypothetical protein MKY20_23825 [Cytobacillus sp. FSL W8-0315]|uniref:hypothetical protein n=1 Tax=Cytobacillus sp. FSL W8-0315 TaxID=2921600 RepID=UPI0030F88C94
MENLKDIKLTKHNTPYFTDLNVKLPRFCPHCSQAISAQTIEFYKLRYTSKKDLNLFLHLCPDCSRFFMTLHLRNSDSDKTLEFVSVYPNLRKANFHQLIEEISPRFVDVYNQAYTAEQQNNFEVAGAGYRLSLEILIKDYAINSLKKNPEEVKKKKLADAIRDYLDDQEALTSADVVRILGNDYVHYEQKYEEVGFPDLKWYLEMFIKKIESKLLFLNPPVRTRQLEKRN